MKEATSALATRMTNNRLRQSKRLFAEQLEQRVLLAADPIKINFQSDETINTLAHPELTGYLADDGDAYGNRGNGLQYGWLDGNLNPDDQRQTRNRDNNDAADERFDTLNHMIKGDNHSWQIALENGQYDVRIVAGDPSNIDQVEDLELIGGDNVVAFDDPDGQDHWDEFNIEGFEVANGLMRISPRDSGSNQKLAFIEITPLEMAEPELATLATRAASDVRSFSAQLNAEVTFDGNDAPAVSIYYGDNDAGTSFGWDHTLTFGFHSGPFSTVLENLLPSTQYYYRAFGINRAGISWAPTSVGFMTLALDPPVVANNGAAAIMATSATISGNASGAVTPDVIVYWGDNDGGTNPTAWDNAVDLGEADGLVSLDLENLDNGTTYYFRTFAANLGGETWAATTSSFTTLTISEPLVTNHPVIDVGAFEAVIGGQVTATGNETPTVMLYWGDNDAGQAAAAWDNSVPIGERDGFFSTTIVGLTDGQTYYYRSAAANSAGITWASSTESFVTLTVALPNVVNDPVTQVTSSSAELGGTVTDFGNDAPFVSIYYGIENGGTDANGWQNVVNFAPEFGTFAQIVFNLSSDTTYFYRARATNAAGTTWAPSTVSFTTLEAPTLLITEFLTSNDSSLTTRIRATAGGSFGDTMNPDWIEIHNPGSGTIDLGGLSLTDDQDNPKKWQFPAGTRIAPTGYLVVFASGEDITDPVLDQNGRLHTNFKLSTGGEFLAITDADRNVIHGYSSYPVQRSDVSYGIDLASNEHYYSGMTPGAANTNATINLVADTTFSVRRGFYEAPFDVVITTQTAGATIVYTTDGSKPTETNGTKVAAASDSVVPAASVNVATTTLLRAFAFKNGFDPTNVDTQSYIFLNDVLLQATDPNTGRQATPAGLPTSWGAVTGDYQVDPDIVHHARESDRLVPDDLKSVPTISIVMDNKDLFGSNQIYLSGSGSPRSMSIEMITADGSEEFQQDASIQMQGGSSTDRWKDYKLSLRVKFQSPFGPSKLNHALYKDSQIDRYDNLILDGVLNHAWVHSGQHTMPQYIQDQYVADLHNSMDGYSPSGRFVHLYLNGLYWGMYYMHDRPDHAWAAEVFGGSKDSYHAVKHSGTNVIHDGNGNSARSSYTAMVSAARLVQDDPSSLSKWEALTEQLDVDNFITYLLANWFTGNHDWPQKNWYATAPDGGPWRFHSWDAEHATDSNNDVGESPSNLHSLLDGNAEYLVRMADLIHKHFFNEGALTVDSSSQMWRDRMDEIDRAIVGESARWGDNRSSHAHTREEWLRYNGGNGGLLEDYFPTRSTVVLGQLRSAGIYPALDAPEFSQHGGSIDPGFGLVISNPDNAGTVYYTLDGSDPRLPGRTRNPAAIAFNGSIALPKSLTVNARILNGSTWSALTQADFIISAAGLGDLVISEVNYNPFPALSQFGEPNVDPDEFEFVEIQNVTDHTIDLAGVRLARTVRNGSVNGIEFTFESQWLGAGQRMVVVANQDAFSVRYGDELSIAIAAGSNGGRFTGRLSNTGEQITLLAHDGQIIQQFVFNDSGNWPGRADGGGSSLEFVPSSGDPNDANGWRSSSEFGGSPGAAGDGPIDDVVINELLTHTDVPQIDAIELHNSTGAPIDISNWYISDSGADYFRYQVPFGTSIAAGSYAMFNENELGFGFRGQESDDAWLIQADANGRPLQFMDHVRFGAAPNGVALGRWPNGSGNLFPMTNVTLNNANVGPILSDIFVSEINYHPAEPVNGLPLTTDELEFVEVWNTSDSRVDIGNWRLDDAIEFDFPPETVLPPNTGVIVVGFDARDTTKSAAFRTAYGLPVSQSLLGPYDGQLDNGGEKLELEQPEDPAQVGLGYVLVDRIAYEDTSPWPIEADGTGKTIHRNAARTFGDFSASWTAADPSPGAATFVPRQFGDLNGDGLEDAADIDLLCSSLSSNDLALDMNGDGQLNAADYRFFIFDVLRSTIGDANVDGHFNSTDLIQVFQTNEYEDAISGNSTWAEGDWNCDGDFDSGDLVVAFQAGDYAAVARSEVTSANIAAAVSSELLGINARSSAKKRRAEIGRVQQRPVDLNEISIVDSLFQVDTDQRDVSDVAEDSFVDGSAGHHWWQCNVPVSIY